jgi:hypothetical protein
LLKGSSLSHGILTKSLSPENASGMALKAMVFLCCGGLVLTPPLPGLA